MAKELPYFKFNVAEFLLGRISTKKYDVIGIFTLVCCHYWHKECSISLEELEEKLSKSSIKKLISLDFLKINEGEVSIPFLDEQYIELSKTHKVNSDNGSKGARVRWSKKHSGANGGANGEPIALRKDKDIEVDKDKIKIRKDIPTESEFLNYCQTFLNGTYLSYEKSLKAKFLQWSENKWRDGYNKPISNWKTKIQNTLPYLKPERVVENKVNQTLDAHELTKQKLGIHE